MALTGLVAANNLSDVVDIERTWDNIGNNISATVFVPAATLDLNFAGNKSLVDNVSGSGLVTFARASSGTFVGSNGLIQSTASGVPRFDHNPTTGESLGLLVEEARTNLRTASVDFSTGWTFNSNVTVASGQISPTGDSTASLVTAAAGTLQARLGEKFVFSSSIVYTRSWFVKKTNQRYIWCGDQNSGGYSPNYRFDLDLGVGVVFVDTNNRDRGFSIIPFANGYYRISVSCISLDIWTIIASNSSSLNPLPTTYTHDGTETFIIWGYQVELGAFPTSYIPTTSSAVTRAADVASTTGTNFSNWYNRAQGSFYVQYKYNSGIKNISACILGTSGYEGNGFINSAYGTSATTLSVKTAVGFTDLKALNPGGNSAYSNPSVGDSVGGKFEGYPVDLEIGTRLNSPSGSKTLNGTIARVVYHPIRLTNTTLQAFTTYGPVSNFPYSFSIKGRDILALKEVNKTSTRDFIFTKGLLSKAQPRLTTASQYTSSGVALRDAAMPKFAPVTRGNYFFSSGLTLSGATVQINGTNALSIATSPFSSSTATVPLLFAGLRPQTNWRISEAMASGVVASPESAIPIATGDFLLFMKAGQS